LINLIEIEQTLYYLLNNTKKNKTVKHIFLVIVIIFFSIIYEFATTHTRTHTHMYKERERKHLQSDILDDNIQGQ